MHCTLTFLACTIFTTNNWPFQNKFGNLIWKHELGLAWFIYPIKLWIIFSFDFVCLCASFLRFICTSIWKINIFIEKINWMTHAMNVFYMNYDSQIFVHIMYRFGGLIACSVLGIPRSFYTLTHLCPPLRSTFAVRETASLGIMGETRTLQRR